MLDTQLDVHPQFNPNNSEQHFESLCYYFRNSNLDAVIERTKDMKSDILFSGTPLYLDSEFLEKLDSLVFSSYLTQVPDELPIVRHRTLLISSTSNMSKGVGATTGKDAERDALVERLLGQCNFGDPIQVEAVSAITSQFARGIEGGSDAIVEIARRLIDAAYKHTRDPSVTIDEEDGSVDFDLRLGNNLLVMANLFTNGEIDASVYDDSDGLPVKVVKRFRRGSIADTEFINLLREGLNAST